MIVYDLICDADHRFEAWFRSGDDFAGQNRRGDVLCPHCGSDTIEKALSAPNVGRKGNQSGAIAAAPAEAETTVAAPSGHDVPENLRHEFTEVVQKIRKHVEKNCDYVGREFPEEARKIHYGEADARGIYGEASLEESEELQDEGIDVLPLPFGKGKKRADA